MIDCACVVLRISSAITCAYHPRAVFAVASFPVGVAFHGIEAVWASTLCHGMVHILGNVGNVVLYAGSVPPPPWA